jgi:hypothetical protein
LVDDFSISAANFSITADSFIASELNLAASATEIIVIDPNKMKAAKEAKRSMFATVVAYMSRLTLRPGITGPPHPFLKDLGFGPFIHLRNTGQIIGKYWIKISS